jgi:hypothetical protein
VRSIVQDIAFFDGTTTGELTSRMNNDAAGTPFRLHALQIEFIAV